MERNNEIVRCLVGLVLLATLAGCGDCDPIPQAPPDIAPQPFRGPLEYRFLLCGFNESPTVVDTLMVTRSSPDEKTYYCDAVAEFVGRTGRKLNAAVFQGPDGRSDGLEGDLVCRLPTALRKGDRIEVVDNFGKRIRLQRLLAGRSELGPWTPIPVGADATTIRLKLQQGR